MSGTMTKWAGTMADKSAIETLIARLCAAWDEGDADAYADLFMPDGDYVAFDGTYARGRRAIAEMHRPLFTRFLKGSRLIVTSSAIRSLSPDVALVHLRGAVQPAWQRQPRRSRLSVQTLVAVREAERWRFAAFQNTRYHPFAETLFGRLLTLAGIAPHAPEKAEH